MVLHVVEPFIISEISTLLTWESPSLIRLCSLQIALFLFNPKKKKKTQPSVSSQEVPRVARKQVAV